MPKMVDDQIEALGKAMDEAKETTRKLHEARSDALDVLKKQKAVITESIATEVTSQVNALAEDVKTEMRERISEMIDAIDRDLRAKLSL